MAILPAIFFNFYVKAMKVLPFTAGEKYFSYF